MHRHIFIYFIFFSSFFSGYLEALNRDYCSEWEKNETSLGFDCSPYCLDCALRYFWPNEIDIKFWPLIPQVGPPCSRCHGPCGQDYLSCFPGYLDDDFSRYLHHFKRHLIYCYQNKDCICFWPEYSQEAAQINDSAYLLFRDLISTTALSSIKESWDQPFVDQIYYTCDRQCKYFDCNYWSMNLHRLTVSFVAQQFHFSDYYHVCKDIEQYSKSKYNQNEIAKIKDKLEDILEVLYPKFYSLYLSCYKKHPTHDIEKELFFMKCLINDISVFEETLVSKKTSCFSKNDCSHINDLLISHSDDVRLEFECSGSPSCSMETTKHTKSKTGYIFSPESYICLEQGTLFNNLLLYKEAIQILSKAIQLNPSNTEAYIERSMAYFETNQITLAMKDYESAKKLTVMPPFQSISQKKLIISIYASENKLEFSKGLILGTIDGAKVSSLEFIPSIFSCCRGILNGLWAFVCSPIDVSQEMLDSAYSLGEYINNHSTEECFQCIVPELKELSLSWDKLDEYSRGQKIGFLIGKYGVDIFAPVGTLKGISKLRDLKRANTMLTLESCAASQAKQARIIEESLKRAIFREEMIIQSFKKGKILTKTANVQYHVMQPKHAWSKILKLTGVVEEDFMKVIALIEEKKIINPKNLKNTVALPKDAPVKNIHLMEYRAIVEGQQIQIFIEKYLDSGEIFLKNAWVATK